VLFSSFQFIHLHRLKIPREQSCAGSSPAPSILLIQYLKTVKPYLKLRLISIRTQFLRTPPKQASTNQASFLVFSFLFLSSPYFFSRDARDQRDIRAEFVSLPRFSYNVTNVAVCSSFYSLPAFCVKFYLKMRKKCVNARKITCYIVLNISLKHITLGIVNRLLLFILIFFTLFCFIGDRYGNDS